MRVDRLLCAATTLLGLACFSFSAAAHVAKAELKNASGKSIGEANFIQTNNGVLIRLEVNGLPAGEHAFHVHAVGKCEPPFTTAGDHFNPGGKKHGLEAADGAHAGDMPNLHIPASGNLSVEAMNTTITLAKGRPNSVFDADGSAVVIHSKADDYKSDPAGNGSRVFVGVNRPWPTPCKSDPAGTAGIAGRPVRSPVLAIMECSGCAVSNVHYQVGAHSSLYSGMFWEAHCDAHSDQPVTFAGCLHENRAYLTYPGYGGPCRPIAQSKAAFESDQRPRRGGPGAQWRFANIRS